MQHMVATASSVLLDVDRRKQQLPRETSALRKAMELGQTRPLEALLHRMRCRPKATNQPQPHITPLSILHLLPSAYPASALCVCNHVPPYSSHTVFCHGADTSTSIAPHDSIQCQGLWSLLCTVLLISQQGALASCICIGRKDPAPAAYAANLVRLPCIHGRSA